MEAVFRTEIVRTFSNDFRPVPVGTHRNLTEIHWEKSGQFPAGILLPVPGNSGVFLQDPLTGIFDLGNYVLAIMIHDSILKWNNCLISIQMNTLKVKQIFN
jgi:hypothetical protein